jgi:hypothetical protein
VIAATFHVLYFAVSTYKGSLIRFRKKKPKGEEKKKKLTYGPNDTFAIVWARFCHCILPSSCMSHKL